MGREYVITYRDRLEGNERIVDGAFWTPTPSSSPEVSIEQSIRDRFHIRIGDTIRFDIAGRPLTARVSSVREINWRDARRGGFMFVFRPGIFDQAPVTFIAPFKAPADPVGRARLQRDLAARFPNVSVIDVREILQTAGDILHKISLAVTIVGGLLLLGGGLVLVGSVSMTKFQRVYEVAIFKTLGASTRLVGGMLLLEYGVLGLLAGIIGSSAALVLSWGLSRYGLQIQWSPALGLNAVGIAATAVLVAGVGLLASLDVLQRRPLSTLRAE